MAKPRQHHNRLDTPEDPGEGTVEDEGEGVVVGTEGEGGGEKQRKEAEDPPPTEELMNQERDMRPGRKKMRRARQRMRSKKSRGKGTERPHGGTRSRSLVWGRMTPPHRKTQTSRDPPLKVRTCYYRESMDTSRITTAGHTWTGE